MLKLIRRVLAAISIVATTLLFVDFTGTAARLWPWMAKIQFMPAVLSANIVVLVCLVAATLLFGRIYCSVICPLGILQDVANWLRVKVSSKKAEKYRFGYSRPRTKTRLWVLTAFAVLVIVGLSQLLAASIAGLIEPYSAYGRIASQIFAPAWDWVNNLLAGWSESQPDNYMFYRVGYAVSIPILIVAIVTLAVVIAMAWIGGRDYCNSICPVGTLLGYLSKYSLLKIHINEDKCKGCGLCARACKAKCIDPKAHAVDYTRCVDCMDCIGICKDHAIAYSLGTRKEKPRAAKAKDIEPALEGRRQFLTTSGLLAGALAVQAVTKTDGGLTALKDKKPVQRLTKIAPAGAVSLKHLGAHCTACQLCIQSCPSHVLKPTLTIEGFMQPYLDFTEGFCAPECTRCASVCPVGAIEPISVAEKSSTKIGTAVVDTDICLPASQGKRCGSCARHCPAGAIEMIEQENHRWRPVVNESACIGCGSCEYHCPVGSVEGMEASGSAIHVEGLPVHYTI